MENSGYIDPEKVFDAFRNCITEPKCRNCEGYGCEGFHQKVEIPATLALDTLNLLKSIMEDGLQKRKEMCRVLFNRCAAMTHGSLCSSCWLSEACRKERSN